VTCSSGLVKYFTVCKLQPDNQVLQDPLRYRFGNKSLFDLTESRSVPLQRNNLQQVLLLWVTLDGILAQLGTTKLCKGVVETDVGSLSLTKAVRHFLDVYQIIVPLNFKHME